MYLMIFLASKPLEFYRRGTNHHVNRWQKYLDVQGSHFEGLKHCRNSFSSKSLKPAITFRTTSYLKLYNCLEIFSIR